MRIQSVLAIFALIFCFSAQLEAQKEETVLGSRGLRLSGAWGGWTNVLTGMGNSNTYMTGGFGGLEFGKTLFVGFAGYDLANDVQFDKIDNKDFNFDYGGLMLGYGIKSYRPVHGMINMMVGSGDVRYMNEEKDRVLVIQPSAGVEINIFRWFHLGLDGGYRFISDTNTALGKLNDKDLSGAFGQLTLKFGYSWGRKTGWGNKSTTKTRSSAD